MSGLVKKISIFLGISTIFLLVLVLVSIVISKVFSFPYTDVFFFIGLGLTIVIAIFEPGVSSNLSAGMQWYNANDVGLVQDTNSNFNGRNFIDAQEYSSRNLKRAFIFACILLILIAGIIQTQPLLNLIAI